MTSRCPYCFLELRTPDERQRHLGACQTRKRVMLRIDIAALKAEGLYVDRDTMWEIAQVLRPGITEQAFSAMWEEFHRRKFAGSLNPH